jgi:L,D-transpeptidase catalytic domain/Putative peptidoglycan binding domain
VLFMRRTFAATAGSALLVAGLWASTDEPATAAHGIRATALTSASKPHWTLASRFAREGVRMGARDDGVHAIEHIRELQYRLRWVGQYHKGISGRFGILTMHAVRRFQRQAHLKPSGRATHRTWRVLIRKTIRHRGRIPHFCKTAGWHACYDRSMHQVTLWRNGSLWNSWLVRGGSAATPTRVGTHRVYLRVLNGYSYTYNSPMPYAQFFDGGIAFHGSVFMTDPFVDHSHGCVNFYLEDARQLWRLTATRTLWATVYGAWS